MIFFEDYQDFLEKLEEATGYQVYDQRTDATGVKTPYIVCLRLGNEDFLADNKRWLKRDNININLHTYQANHEKEGERTTAENKVETYLEECGYIFDTDFDWLDDINLHRSTYSIEVAYE